MAEKRLDNIDTMATEQGCETGQRHKPGPKCSGGSRGIRKWRPSTGVPLRLLRPQPSPENAARERSRVRNLRQAFHSLQAALPSVPPDTKLSKLDVLLLATNYIAHLTHTLDQGEAPEDWPKPSKTGGYLHPVKKWPMRSLLYCGSVEELLSHPPGLCEEENPQPLCDMD